MPELCLLDPKYSGFKPLDDDFELSIEEIISGRQQYFPEGKHVSQEFVTYMKITMEELEENKRSNRQTLKRGFIFFLLTCGADYLVCTI